MASLLASAAACGEDVQIDFAQENADAFMAACTTSPEDLLLYTRLCQCVIDTAQARLRFAEFAQIDADLRAEGVDGAPAPELPPEIVDIVAECVIEEADL